MITLDGGDDDNIFLFISCFFYLFLFIIYSLFLLFLTQITLLFKPITSLFLHLFSLTQVVLFLIMSLYLKERVKVVISF